MKSQNKSIQSTTMEVEPNESYRDISWGIKFMRLYLKVLNKIAPKKAVRKTQDLFLTPHKRSNSSFHDKIFADGTTGNIQLNDKTIKIWKSCQYPSTLLIHGWSSSSHKLRHLIRHFEQNDIGVMTFDLPAHGMSSGRSTNLLEAEHTIHKIISSHSSIRHLVGYSFGAAAMLAPLKRTEIDTAITLGAPLHYQLMTRPFFDLLQVPDNIVPNFFEKLEHLVGRKRQDWIDPSVLNKDKLSSLIIHDTEDGIVPFKAITALVDTFENVDIRATSGYGHRGLLKSPEVFKMVTSFLGNNL